MVSFRASAVVLAAATLVSHVQAWVPELPSCLSPFQPFVYSGCYQEPGNGNNALAFRSSLDQSNMTIEECVADCKGNGFRLAGLEYYGVCYCGQTVDGPQVDESQCTLPCSANSSEICGGDNTLSVYQDPTFLPINNQTIADYASLGCWTDDSSLGRALGYPQDAVFGNSMTTETCLQACKDGGYPFAGTEFSGECYCGVVIANGTGPAPAASCNMPCYGNSSETCGGPALLSLYVAVDLESLQPCGYVPPPVSSSTTTTTSSTTTSTTTSSTTSTTTSTTTSSTTSTTTSTTTSSTTCTTTSTTSTTSKTTTTSTTSSVCTTTTVVPPTCEYGCGNWCSSPIPNWSDSPGCSAGSSNCALQVSSCFNNAGWPGSMNCFNFAGWCKSIDSYCKAGGKSKSDCFNKNPPSGGGKPTTSTITIPCKTTTTPTSTPTTSTKCPIPTPTGICTQPSNSYWGYGPGNSVGGIDMPSLTCNDLKSDFAQNPFKLYTDPDSTKCSSFPRGGCPSACSAACKLQYNQCIGTYAQGCKSNQQTGSSWGGFYSWLTSIFNWKRDGADYFTYSQSSESEKRSSGWSDSYNTANSKCQQQYTDCLNANKGTSGSGKCGSWGNGW